MFTLSTKFPSVRNYEKSYARARLNDVRGETAREITFFFPALSRVPFNTALICSILGFMFNDIGLRLDVILIYSTRK